MKLKGQVNIMLGDEGCGISTIRKNSYKFN